MKKIILSSALWLSTALFAFAQDGVHLETKTLSNVDYHNGQLKSAVGTHNIQTMRANRDYPEKADGLGYTYNHAPMLAYFNGTFYLEYLNAPVGEHMPPGLTMLQTSKNGYDWTKPEILFPKYKVPDGYSKPNRTDSAKDLYAITHHRVGFFTLSNGKLLAMTHYGVCFDMKDSPNDGTGIGRVVREIKKDGSFGPIYFIRYNHNFNEKNTDYPFYTKSKDKGFKKACEELLADPLYTMQWVEESDGDDPIIPLKKRYKAFSYYHLNDTTVVGLWKHALTSISKDGGKTWPNAAYRAPGFVNSNAKIWGQKTSDGKFATVYNPSEFRWPLAVSTSVDGLKYTDLFNIHGDITPMRYGGNYKSCGPQYVRGILENNGNPEDGAMWLTYSVNKEDLWVSKVPVPITDRVTAHPNEVFNDMPEGHELDMWNIYSPLWAPVKIEKQANGKRVLSLQDWDLFDYAKAERIIPQSTKLNVSFSVIPAQNDQGNLQIEVQDGKGQACTQIIFENDGTIMIKVGARYNKLADYEPNKQYDFDLYLETATRSITTSINGEEAKWKLFYNPVESFERVVFRTGDIPNEPNKNTIADRFTDLPNASQSEPKVEFSILNLQTSSKEGQYAVLNSKDFKNYVDYFNNMEEEKIVQAIPNSESWEWMEANIPLFECPQQNFEELYYFRWWSFRKHIKETPVGYIFTEFLVDRSYADKYNLISCALGHHIYEGRWLHDRKYLDQYLNVWFRGNDGKPMKKLRSFSSWTADALYNRYMIDQNRDFLLNMYPDLTEEYSAWEGDRLLPSGLFWQEDVKDGMEETISGGRKKQYARPTINSYMYANAKALETMADMIGDKENVKKYNKKAEDLKKLINNDLWNKESNFYETLRSPNNFANAREAIGYIPWYYNIPEDSNKYAQAWNQVTDTEGFLCPYGMTTAERRHPEFRTRGVGKCEWDGAIWPFASAQTLTAMANLLNNYIQDVINDSIYFNQMELYVESQYHRGRPYIGEYQDEVTGYWLKGDQERSRYYNHSTFNDLVITGLIGLRPRPDNILEVNPLLPKNTWDWFCLDNVLYHDHIITIIWDKNGDKYNLGSGLTVLVDGEIVANRKDIGKITYNLK